MPAMIVATLSAMLAMSAIAYLILPRGAQVPMQWDLRGRPTWKAPKLVAVLFSPALALLVFAAVSRASVDNPQEMGWILPLIAGSLLVVHALHLVLAQWHFRVRK